MNEISIYNFNQKQVRTQLIDNVPWFCLKDVCNILNIKNLAMLKQRLNPKGLSQTYLLTKGGKQKAFFVNEPNLYKVIFRSDKPIARDFENWVCEEVLPSIRKTGSYIANTEATVEVSPYTRRLPSGKKEIVLSEKARSEIGGIVKAVLQAQMINRENIREILRGVIREEIADYILKEGIKQSRFNNKPTADGLPVANWVCGIIHGANALNNLIEQLCIRQKNAVDLLESKN